MPRADVKNRILQIVGMIANRPIADLPDNTALESLSIESLDLVEIVIELEAEFAIVIPEEAMERFSTIGDVVDYVDKNAKG